ncbi:hypothetical protein [Natrinema salaciae]|uniref:DUF8159 domain-containing protein n=1 Tax=Natrinema salaciae TaxID=1186196 RepID=A0A1H9C221_9EURY|nr:hypothetical protein [Natrinema salaciae]SEP95007.1 hypothetical protein SAMN04489841_0926 [Natrinema salaciae]
MTDDFACDPASTPSRRRFLGTAAAVGTTATAGCLGSLLGSAGANETEIEPEEPSDPRSGTPGEFYTLVERNDIPVESLRWDESDLVLEYDSQAETEAESKREIEVITTVYNEILVKHGAGVGMLFAENTTPFDGQAHGWGVKTEWCERYNAAVGDGGTGSDNETGTDGDGSSGGNGTDGETDSNETERGVSGAGTAAILLISNVLNTRVYAEDLAD